MNAATELLDEINQGNLKMICAEIMVDPTPVHDGPWAWKSSSSEGEKPKENESKIILPLGFTSSDLEIFLAQLDFNYDNSFGSQVVFGYVWLSDGAWLERYEYDGSENWVVKRIPVIPPSLMTGNLF